MRYSKGQITVEARLSGPRLSGFLEYPDLHLWLHFSWILITISHILCPELNFFPSNYVIELQCELNLFHFKAQMWVYFTLTRTTTNMFQFSELWLATICSIAEWNFTYSPLSYSVLLLAHSNSFFFFSVIQTLNYHDHLAPEFGGLRFDLACEQALWETLAQVSRTACSQARFDCTMAPIYR